ncbi:hypothetical protein [Mycoplasmopsis caviae]|uniref:Uncharacterized protein n=1 Tax=Mycoplasmopsis caviae TaxID=55603 RepID=A0A3P8ME26_9BACT|nr:hypothetical protein [Mycoplasmopsis caviae]VDR42540.1 Uncharacterised protein [Mycoplasmopsis caviae]
MCWKNPKKRRELLQKLYDENAAELANPALIEEQKPISGECEEFMCLVKKESKIDPKVRRQQLV